MRLPRFRLKLWMLAVLVALIGFGIGVERTVKRARVERERAAYHSKVEASCRRHLLHLEQMLAWTAKRAADSRARGNQDEARRLEEGDRGLQRMADRWRLLLDHSSRMRRKHERAARYPFLPVKPDPPIPQ